MSPPRRLTTWCRLLRLPNLFTVPGDPLAGFMLATGGVLHWRVAGAMATSLLLYCAGLLLNDYFDRAVDAKERPDRPIPSGAVSPLAVALAGALLLLGGVLLARWTGSAYADLAAVTLAGAILAYDGGLKRVRFVGPVLMGFCRAASVVLGAAFASRATEPPVLAAAGLVWAYITAVSFLAAREATSHKPGAAAYVPGLLLLAAGAAVLWYSSGNHKRPLLTLYDLDGKTIWLMQEGTLAALALFALALAEAEFAAFRAHGGRLPTPALIGRLIRLMITVQAAWCAWSFSPLLGHGDYVSGSALLGVALTWLAARLAAWFSSRHFYGS